MKPVSSAASRSIAVERDGEGLRVAFLELLEEGFQQGKLERVGAAMLPTRREAQMDAVVAKRTLSPGYYTFASHIFRLDAERAAGLPLDTAKLAAFEGAALRTLAACRNDHKAKHPACSRCGTQQDTRHHTKCIGCGADFTGKGKK